MSISEFGLDQGEICIQFEMHFGDGFVVRFNDNWQNGGNRKVFNNFVNSGHHDVGGNYHGSMPDDGEINISNN